MNSTLYMKAQPQKVAKNVIFSGDPWRVEVLKNYLDNPVKIGFFREFNTYTGTYKGVPITITSTGIGSPSAAIAMEEMYDCGMKLAIRMGTIMALDDALLGNYIVPIASVRGEATSDTYVEKSYPAVADFELVQSLIRTFNTHGQKVHQGINATFDGYYSQMKKGQIAINQGFNINERFSSLKKQGIIGIDMESSCLFVLGRLMGVRTAAITLVTVLHDLVAQMPEKERIIKEDELCRLTLESVYRFEQENQNA